MSLRFAFDLGTSSLGWAVYTLDNKKQPNELVGSGVRIYSDGRDPQTGESNAKDRREPRAMRRSRDRYLQRRRYVMDALTKAGLMPGEQFERKKLVDLNPYEIRANALSESLNLHHIGRAFFHINQRRGFKSNRKTDDPSESGKIASAAKRLRENMSGYETLGDFLYARQSDPDVRKRKPVRIRMDASNKDELYEFYPQRQMLEDEFDLICERQKGFNPNFPSDEKIAIIRKAIFDQRPLKEVKPGYCSFYDDQLPKEEQYRLARAHPLAEDFVYYQMVNHIKIDDEGGYKIPMTLEIRNHMISILKSGKNLTWTEVRKTFGLSTRAGKVNLQERGDKDLKTGIQGSALTSRFKGTDKKPGPFFSQWDGFTVEQIETILAAYKSSNTDEELLAALSEFKLNIEQAKLAVKCSLPDGYIAVCQRVANKIVAELKKDIITYAEACKRANLHHSDRRDGEVFDRLPFYNEVDELKRHLGYGTGDPKDPRDKRNGRIANPTVHIGLNQMRRTINALMDKYGRPNEIVLELARELKQSKKQKEEWSKKRNTFKKLNDKRRDKLEELGVFRQGDRRKIRESFQRMRLWEELADSPNDRRCPYSGKFITIENLLSNAIEIEHILPRSRTLDDSMANKTVAYREWNRLKRNLTPSEAAAIYPDKFNQDDMTARTKTMPPNKRWRFQDDAKERFDDEEDFLARQLKETQYLGKIMRHYLSKINPGDPQQDQMQVWVTTGRLTAELRRKWGLHLGTNYKNRDDHRHHALDACVIGVIDRALIKKLATAAARDEKAGIDRVLSNVEQPFDGFSDQVNARVRKVIISHRPDHSIGGQLHEEAAYGLVRENDENINRGETSLGNVVSRRAVSSLTPKQIGQVRDLKIRQALEQVLYQAQQDYPEKKELDKKLPAYLTQWSRETGTRRVRTLKPESSIVPVDRRKDGKRYKYVVPGSNHHMDIVETPDGKWHGVAQSTFEANQEVLQKKKGKTIKEKWKTAYPDAKFIMRVHKGDTLQLFDDDGMNRVKRVVVIQPSQNTVILAGHTEAGTLQKRHADKNDPFRWDFARVSKLKGRRARRVHIDATGRVRTIPHGKV